MKRISLFGQAALLLLVCFALVVAASLAYRKKLHAKRLERILSFQTRRIDKCTVGPAILCEKTTTLKGDDANSIARRFAQYMSSHCRYVRKNSPSDFHPTHRISFHAGNLTWQFSLRLKSDQAPAAKLIDCRSPQLNATIILDHSPGPELEALFKTVPTGQTQQPQEQNPPG
ncbi:MAG TPA: hypothetical protein VMX13_04040 [Sedimentisphaerales bacterium]|nr:hypothetical protein [Sedimentisphaerales bacterium]